MPADPIPPTVEWRDGRVRLIDQRKLPGALEFLECVTVADVCDAITSLAVRGAPALGATGAFGVALAASTGEDVPSAAKQLRETRPTAVNLAWGVNRVLTAWEEGAAAAALAAAERIAAEDVAANRVLGAFGAELVDHGARVLTHCNAGSLATVGYGTALGVVRAAAEAGKQVHVWVGETRPVLQGARLTAWEMEQLGIDATLVADVAAGSLMAGGEVDLVVVGADRIAANGDVANKIGTYPLAVLARPPRRAVRSGGDDADDRSHLPDRRRHPGGAAISGRGRARRRDARSRPKASRSRTAPSTSHRRSSSPRS